MASKKALHPVSVVIPIYKTELSKSEKLSLDRCLTVLNKHPITVISPQGLSFDKIFFKDVQVKFEFFDKTYFQSVDDYSKLMLSTEFYRRFLNYKYILIYQLDALVFKDDLLAWCNKGFDYIGAPWLNEDEVAYWSYQSSTARRFLKKLNIFFNKGVANGVGNGGLCLRNVKKCLFVLLIFRQKAYTWKVNEDIFWAYFVTSYFPFFKIPDRLTSLQFSFESYPDKCYELNNKTLPFGCHAWEKHNIDFWRQFIDFG